MRSTLENKVFWDANEVELGLARTNYLLPSILGEVKSLIEGYYPTVNRSIEYYNLILGNWCICYAHFIYANWLEVVRNPKKYSTSAVSIVECYQTFMQRIAYDDAFHEGVRHIIQLGISNKLTKNCEFNNDNYLVTNVASENSSWQKRVLQLVSTSKPSVLLTFPYFKCSNQEWARAVIDWRKWAVWDDLTYPINLSGQFNKKWRLNKVADRLPATDFEQIVLALLPLYIPVLHLEARDRFRNELHLWGLRRPKIAYSANALHTHDAFKLLVADWKEEGTLLYYHQHGGCYGMDKSHVYENYEVSLSNRFFSYGWTDERKNVIPLSPPILNIHSCKKKWSIMLLGFDLPRHVYRLHYGLQPGTLQLAQEEVIHFLTNCPVSESLLIRPARKEITQGIVERMRNAAPTATFDRSNKPFRSFAQSKIVVHGYLATGWLETISMDIPTVCFYNPQAYAFRDSVQPWIDELERVGVLHRSGAAAAKFIVGLNGQPERWWRTAEVRKVVDEFVKNYSFFSQNWKRDWEIEFKSNLTARL